MLCHFLNADARLETGKERCIELYRYKMHKIKINRDNTITSVRSSIYTSLNLLRTLFPPLTHKLFDVNTCLELPQKHDLRSSTACFVWIAKRV